jgi:hypothetical protein
MLGNPVQNIVFKDPKITSVKKDFENMEQKFFLVARRIAIYSQLSFILSCVLSFVIRFLEIKFTWLLEWNWLLEDIFLRVWLTSSFLGIIVNMIVPGLLFVVSPTLGHAWLRGSNRRYSPSITWKQLSDGMAFLSILNVIVFFIFGMAILYMLIINGWFGQTLINVVNSAKQFFLNWWLSIISI